MRSDVPVLVVIDGREPVSLPSLRIPPRPQRPLGLPPSPAAAVALLPTKVLSEHEIHVCRVFISVTWFEVLWLAVLGDWVDVLEGSGLSGEISF